MNFINFEELYSLRPKDVGVVKVFNKETGIHKDKKIFRAYKDYIQSPIFEPNIKKSHMHGQLSKTTPKIVKELISKAKQIDNRYNQLIINWYESGEYIENHRDCDARMVEDYKILIMSFNEISARSMVFKNLHGDVVKEVKLGNGEFIEITEDENKNLKHEVGTGIGRRISATFRMFK